jgi:hypothetical protein
MDIFISYSHDDLEKVRYVVELLQIADQSVYFDEKLQAGQDWKQALRDAISGNDVFMYLLSETSIASEWCRWEYVNAVRLQKAIIPVLLEKIKLPEDLGALQYVDMTKGVDSKSGAKLIGGLLNLAEQRVSTLTTTAPDNPTGQPSRAQVQTQHGNTLSGNARIVIQGNDGVVNMDNGRMINTDGGDFYEGSDGRS